MYLELHSYDIILNNFKMCLSCKKKTNSLQFDTLQKQPFSFAHFSLGSTKNIKGLHRSSSRYHQSGNKWISRKSSNFNFNGSNNGIPEAEWITEKFLAGIHPWSGEDDESPDEKMQEFFDSELTTMLNDDIRSNMLSSVVKYF